MSAPVSGITVRAIALAAALLLAAAAPASADSTGTTGPVGYSQPAATAPQSNTVTNTQTATATGGAGGTATGGNAGPAQSGGSHGGDANANGGSAESHNSLESKQSNSGRDSYSSSSGGNGDRYGFVSDGQDTFVVQSPKRRGSDHAAARAHQRRSRPHQESRIAGPVIPGEAKQRSGHEPGKSSPSNGGVPGRGGQLPSPNPFFSLLSGSGGGGTGLILLVLAVLGVAIVLPNHRFQAFRMPAAPWRPSAYVSPIELPG